MARPKHVSLLSSDQLYKLWQRTVEKEHAVKRELLAKARATVKELEAFLAGKKTRKDKKGAVTKVKKSRGKRGSLKRAVLALLEKGPQPIKGIVIATKGNYGSVFQTLNNLRKEKLVIKGKERGGAYNLVK
jgi:hypothetical protein